MKNRLVVVFDNGSYITTEDPRFSEGLAELMEQYGLPIEIVLKEKEKIDITYVLPMT